MSKKTNEAVTGEKRQVAEVKVSDLLRAPWNTHDVSDKGSDEFKGLVQSIKKCGIVNRILVGRVGDDSKYGVIDGHRRLEAAKVAGFEVVPVEIVDCTAEEAKMMTAISNIQRLDNDPLLEAELFGNIANNLSVKELAAKVGMDESYVRRRMRLTTLTEKWRKAAEKVPFTVECLENIAAHEPELQDEVFDAEVGESGPRDDGYEWSDFEYDFKRRMFKIVDATFDTSECAKCRYNTATEGMLFADMEDAEGGRCQSCECYRRKNDEIVDATIAKLKEKGVTVVQVKDRWSIPYQYDTSDKRDAKHPQPYVFEINGMKALTWGRKSEEEQKVALTKEEKAKLKEEKRIQRERDAARREACDKIRETVSNRSADVLKALKDVDVEDLAKFVFNEYTRDCDWMSEEDIMGLVNLIGVEEIQRCGAFEFSETEEAEVTKAIEEMIGK